MQSRVLRAGLALAALTAVTVAHPLTVAEAEPQTRPNVVLILLDDARLDDIPAAMPDVVRRIGDAGATFTNFYAPFPLCCPARASLLTGQYPHNHGVLSNVQPTGGWKEFQDGSTLATWLTPTYRTGMIGKYFNQYTPPYQPPGWDEWMVPGGVYNYTASKWFLNQGVGMVTKSIPGYQSDTIGNLGSDFITRNSASNEPYFLYTSVVAPHAGTPSDPDDITGYPSPYVKPDFQDTREGERNTDPSFNEADVSDKVLKPALLTPEQITGINEAFSQRREAEAAAQVGINQMLDAIAASPDAHNTYVMFMSDNGYTLGEHRIKGGKVNPHEVSNHVPFMIQGPGIVPGTKVTVQTSQVDFAATVLHAAGVDPLLPQDGVSLLPLASGLSVSHAPVVIEATDTKSSLDPLPWLYYGVVVDGWKYVERTNGAREMYDLTNDPFELVNQAKNSAYAAKKTELAALVQQYRWCAGQSCTT